MVQDCRRESYKRRRRLKGCLYKVIADGKDISSSAFYVDGRRRIVGAYILDPNTGKPLTNYDTGMIEAVMLRPRRVRLVRKYKI